MAIVVGRKNTAEYFDSYGLSPHVVEVLDFVKSCKKCQYNKKCQQGAISSVCGHYCVYFAIQQWKNVSVEDIVNKFSADIEENDKMVTEWVNVNFVMNTETLINVDFIMNQFCRALSSTHE